MSNKNRLLHLFMALVMLMTYLTFPTALADDTVTVTLNVTNTPVRGDVVLEKKGLQLTRFQDEKDANGYDIMKPVYENGYLAGAKFEIHAAENIVGKEGTTFYVKDGIEGLTAAFQSPLPSFVPFDLLIGILFGCLLKAAVTIKGKNAKKFRKNHEYGSARWGNREDIAPFMDADPRENIILTQTEGLTMKSRIPNPKYARNKGVFLYCRRFREI
ncbi:MAG: hypothetical protein J6A79_02715 [Clostridia bacterium]|nr:hypothetical protein [Clostridia bacterium]